MIDKLLSKIGLMSINKHQYEMEEFRHKCEEFAKDYLDFAGGITLGSSPGFIRGGRIERPAVVIGSNFEVSDARTSGLAFAPWCKRVVVRSCSADGGPITPKARALARICNYKQDGTNNAVLWGAE